MVKPINIKKKKKVSWQKIFSQLEKNILLTDKKYFSNWENSVTQRSVFTQLPRASFHINCDVPHRRHTHNNLGVRYWRNTRR